MLALRSFLIGMAASLLTPARLGELARAACFPGQRLLALTLVAADKLIDIGVLLGLFALSLATWSLRVGVVGLIAINGLWLLAFGGFRFTRTSEWISRKSWLAEPLNRLRDLPQRLVVLNVGLTCAGFGVMMFQFYLLLSSFQPVGWRASLTLPIILVVSNVPMSVSGLGVREATAALLLSRYRVSLEAAVAAAFSLFVVNALLPGLIGFVLSPTLVQRGRGVQ